MTDLSFKCYTTGTHLTKARCPIQTDNPNRQVQRSYLRNGNTTGDLENK